MCVFDLGVNCPSKVCSSPVDCVILWLNNWTNNCLYKWNSCDVWPYIWCVVAWVDQTRLINAQAVSDSGVSSFVCLHLSHIKICRDFIILRKKSKWNICKSWLLSKLHLVIKNDMTWLKAYEWLLNGPWGVINLSVFVFCLSKESS